MSTPFRDLFVELPRAVFEALQGIGEEAARRGLHSAPSAAVLKDWYPAPSDLRTALSPEVAALLRQRYGWKACEWRASPMDATTDIVVEHQCGHRERIRFDEMDLLRAGTAMRQVDAVIRRLDDVQKLGRRCFCVQEAG